MRKTPEVVKLAGAVAEFHRRHPGISDEEVSLLVGLVHRVVVMLMDPEHRVDNH